MNHEDHDDREGHETHPFWRRYHTRLSSPLTPEAEDAMTETIGCAIASIGRWAQGSWNLFTTRQ
jgi:hypothetical protein